MKLFSEQEFIVQFGLLIAAAGFGDNGKELWSGDKKDESALESIMPKVTFDKFMPLYRKEFRLFVPCMYEDGQATEEEDPWWLFALCVSESNSHQQNIIISSTWKVFDESMSAYHPWTTKTGGLPNLSSIIRKPEPLGKYSLHVCF